MDCPHCKSPMFVMEYHGLELDHCPACEGVWFDSGELALLFADAEDHPHPELVPGVLGSLPDARTRERKRRCPACRKSMRKVQVGPGRRVLADVCARGHGLYFDHGEVADLVRDMQFGEDTLPARVVAFLGDMVRCDGEDQDKEVP